MFERMNAQINKHNKSEKFPLVITCEYGGAIFTFLCGIALWIALQKGWIFTDTMWLKKYAFVIVLFAGSVILLKQYYFTEKRLQMKILGLTIRDVPKKDITQVGIITYWYGSKYLLIITQTAPQYIPNRFGTYKEKYLTTNRSDIFLIRYKPEFDTIIQAFYGNYDFIEDNVQKSK